MKDPELNMSMRRDAQKLFEANMAMASLRHLNCWSEDLSKLIRNLEQRIRWAMLVAAHAHRNEHGSLGPWACHACGGDDGHGPCDHCHNERLMTVDDVVELVYRKGASNGC